MGEEILQSFLTGFHILLLLAVIVRSARLIGAEKHSMAMVFFAFGMVSLFFSDMYWLAFGLIRPDMRMPIAANEFAESAAFLLLASALMSILPKKMPLLKADIILTALYTSACTALWIGWSGEWLQDILTGITFGYYLCVCARFIKYSGTFSRKEGAFLGVLALLIVSMEASLFFVTGPIKGPLDLACYALMFAGVIFFFVKTAKSLRAGSASVLMGAAYGAFGWTLSSMYMSAGIYYQLFLLFNTVMFLFMLHATRKEVAPA